jgi:hypothetical protein
MRGGQVTLRDLFWLILFSAITCAWGLDHHKALGLADESVDLDGVDAIAAPVGNDQVTDRPPGGEGIHLVFQEVSQDPATELEIAPDCENDDGWVDTGSTGQVSIVICCSFGESPEPSFFRFTRRDWPWLAAVLTVVAGAVWDHRSSRRPPDIRHPTSDIRPLKHIPALSAQGEGVLNCEIRCWSQG